MFKLMTLALIALPTLGMTDTTSFGDGPWIAIPADFEVRAMMSPQDEIRAMADLDGDPLVTTADEIEMIAMLTQMLGTAPTDHQSGLDHASVPAIPALTGGL
ncbi:hypothetical protein [Yoonia sp. MH D7]